MAGPLAILGGALALGGGLMKGFGAYQQGQFQGELGDFNARQSFIDAEIAQRNADAKAKAIRQHGRKLTGAQRTKYAKAGVRLEGTPLEVMAKSIENIELDAIATRQQGRFEAKQHRARGEFAEEMADRERSAGKLGLITGVLGGFTGAASAGMFG